MPLSIKVPTLAKWGVIFPIAVTCISRGYTLLPIKSPDHESAPAPLVFHSAPWIYSVGWGLAGFLLLAVVLFNTNKIPIYRKGVVSFRLDDLAIIVTIGMYLTWGISYYLSWIFGVINHHPNTDFISGRNYGPIGIAFLFIWWQWFNSRVKQVVENLNQRAEILTAQVVTKDQTYDKINK